MIAELFEFSPANGTQAVGDGGRGAILPAADHQYDQHESKGEGDEGNDPRGAIKAGRRRSGQHCWSVFLDEGLFDQAVAVAAADGGHQFVAHAIGTGTADVIAFKKNLVAAADAHHLVAEIGEARGGIAGAGEGEDRESEDAALQESAENWVESRHHSDTSFGYSGPAGVAVRRCAVPPGLLLPVYLLPVYLPSALKALD